MKVCSRCVMNDKSDITITFDKEGRCNYCTKALGEINTTTYFPGAEGQ
ncbi:MAG: N-acetyl sugar amidotransferase, partial [Mogibacterium sp.]|nr:N-acetyl sugar amidotransferase [Mogibacterium sp.]